MNRVSRFLKKTVRIVVVTAGIVFMLLLAISFTRIPFDIHRWLGSTGATFTFTPTTIVMLGGSGMPSESNLIRLNYTKNLARLFPRARIIIAHPDDSATLHQMTEFLTAFGIRKETILTRSHGTNTREQAIQLASEYPGIVNEKIVVITSPENMYRTLKTFRKLNFVSVGGVAAFENAMFVNLAYNHKKIGGNQRIPDVSESLDLRYNFWNYLKLQITCLREFAAIFYYWLNGWI
ncbi:MAG: YdcF family protein [Bacteroidota bacterium]|nr:YdcF family protein [Bacteroidota bacterium]